MRVIINTANNLKDIDAIVTDISMLSETGNSDIMECEKLDKIILAGMEDKIVIYTIRNTAVNRIGDHIDRGNLRPEDVIVNVYQDNQISQVSNFDEEGFLENWQIGYYLPDSL